MKKLLLLLSFIVCVSISASADNYGISAQLGVSDNNYPATYGNVKKAPLIFGISGFYEIPLSGGKIEQEVSVNKIGIQLGFDFYGENKLETEYGDENNILSYTAVMKEHTKSIPFSLYYKHDKGVKYFSYFIGGGFTFISSDLSVNILGVNTNIKEYKWFPHIVFGGEYRFTKLFALGICFKYNFNAKLTHGDMTLSDRSGLQGTLVGKFYF